MTTDVPAAAAAGRPFSVGGLLAMVAVGAALGMAGDGPAWEIGRQTVALAGEMIRVQPGRALHGLAEQGRRLEAPATARPDHPAIPDPRGRLAQLADELQDRERLVSPPLLIGLCGQSWPGRWARVWTSPLGMEGSLTNPSIPGG